MTSDEAKLELIEILQDCKDRLDDYESAVGLKDGHPVKPLNRLGIGIASALDYLEGVGMYDVDRPANDDDQGEQDLDEDEDVGF